LISAPAESGTALPVFVVPISIADQAAIEGATDEDQDYCACRIGAHCE
jgi:hypothetical protein